MLCECCVRSWRMIDGMSIKASACMDDIARDIVERQAVFEHNEYLVDAVKPRPRIDWTAFDPGVRAQIRRHAQLDSEDQEKTVDMARKIFMRLHTAAVKGGII